MLWYQQTKRYEDQRAEATLNEVDENPDVETTTDENAANGNSETLTLTEPNKPKYANTLSVDC